MTIATLDYQTLRQAVLRLPQQQRLQLIKEAILTLSSDDLLLAQTIDFDLILQDVQNAFAKTRELTDRERDDERYAHLIEKHGP